MELLSKGPAGKGEQAPPSAAEPKHQQHQAARASSAAARASAAGPEGSSGGNVSIQIVRQPGTGLGISVAGGLGSTPFKESDPVRALEFGYTLLIRVRFVTNNAYAVSFKLLLNKCQTHTTNKCLRLSPFNYFYH